MENTYKTEKYAVASGHYLDAIAWSLLKSNIWILIFPVGLFIAGFFDWRFAAIGLILLFLIFPFFITMAILGDGTHPEVVRRPYARYAEFNNDRISIFSIEDSSENEIVPELIETARILGIKQRKKEAKIIIGPRRRDFILIPTDLVPDYVYRQFVDSLS